MQLSGNIGGMDTPEVVSAVSSSPQNNHLREVGMSSVKGMISVRVIVWVM